MTAKELIEKIIQFTKNMPDSLEPTKACLLKDLHGALTALAVEQKEKEKIKEFARHVIKIECWSLFEQDGGSLQDLAEKLGLIEPHIITPEDAELAFDFEVGDQIFVFSKILKGEQVIG